MSFLSCTALLLKRVARFFFIFTNSTTYKKTAPRQYPSTAEVLSTPSIIPLKSTQIYSSDWPQPGRRRFR